MNIRQAKEEIKLAVKAYTAKTDAGTYRIPLMHQRPILLMGPPGIGKTAIMEQVAQECGIGLAAYTMTHHTRQSAIGLPVISQRTYGGETYSVTEYTMSEIISSVFEQMEQTGVREGILFLDEINCVSETLMPAMLQFLQYKSFGGHKLPEGWVIIAAGNPQRYNHAARDLDTVTLDRVKLMEIDADFDIWKAYAAENRLHPAIISYLTLKPDHFYTINSTEEYGEGHVTARSWEDMSDTLLAYEDLGLSISKELFPQYLQCRDIAREFSVFYELTSSLKNKYPLDRILSEGIRIEELSEARFDERLCVLRLLLHKLNELAEKWIRETDLASALFYFFNGVEAQLPHQDDLNNSDHLDEKHSDASSSQDDLDILTKVIDRQLDMRQTAMNKRKAFGLLPADEEYKTVSLLEQVKELKSHLALSNLKTPEQGCQELRLKIQEKFDERKPADALEKAIANCYQFVSETFGSGQEKVIFLAELLSKERLKPFIKSRFPNIKKEADSIFQLDSRERQLRDKLKSNH